MAEQKKEVEAQKTKELAKQIQQEREQEELERISGKKSTTLDRGIDWMYQQGGANSEVAKQDAERRAEEFLLGKEFVGGGATAGDFDNGDQDQGIHNVLQQQQQQQPPPQEDNKPEADASRTAAVAEASVKDRNEDFRMRVEDPMFMVSQKQREKEVQHEKTKALYERVVGYQEDDDDDDDGEDRRAAKKERKRRKKQKKKDRKERKRRHRKEKNYRSDEDTKSENDNDSHDSRSHDSKDDRRHSSHRNRRRRSSSRSPTPSDRYEERSRHKRSRHRSPSYDRDEGRPSSDEESRGHGHRSYEKSSRRGSHHHENFIRRRNKDDRRYDDRNRGRGDYEEDRRHRSRDYEEHHSHHHRGTDHRGSRDMDRDQGHAESKRSHRDYDNNDGSHYRSRDDHRRRSRSREREVDRHHRQQSDRERSSNQKHAEDSKSHKMESYGLQGKATGTSTGPRDLGPNQELLKKKRDAQEAEKIRVKALASNRRRKTGAERAQALEEMQANAEKRDQHRLQQTESSAKGKADDAAAANAGAPKANASFLKDLTQEAHGLTGSSSLSSRVAQNRHTNQRLHDSFL